MGTPKKSTCPFVLGGAQLQPSKVLDDNAGPWFLNGKEKSEGAWEGRIVRLGLMRCDALERVETARGSASRVFESPSSSRTINDESCAPISRSRSAHDHQDILLIWIPALYHYQY